MPWRGLLLRGNSLCAVSFSKELSQKAQRNLMFAEYAAGAEVEDQQHDDAIDRDAPLGGKPQKLRQSGQKHRRVHRTREAVHPSYEYDDHPFSGDDPSEGARL